MSPEMIPTPESSNVSEIGYDGQAQEIWVTFHATRTYVYMNVPAVVWDEFRMSASKGGYVNRVLKPAYPARHA